MSTFEERAIQYVENELGIKLPTKFEVCSYCEGRGTESAYLGAFTRDDMDELGTDFFDDYRAGNYDRKCETCDGKRVSEVLDRSNVSAEMAKEVDEYIDEMLDMYSEQLAELRFGGYY